MRSGRRVRLISPILWAFLCALLIRVALPPGTMVSAEGEQGPAIVLCSGTGVFEVVLDADGKPRPVDRHERDGHEHDSCPFAAGHAFAPPAEPSTPIPARIAWAARTAAPPRAERSALPLRAPPPPSHAPPFFA